MALVMAMAGLGLSGCGESAPGTVSRHGAALADGVLIGVSWPGNEGGFVDGVRLAVDEINQTSGLRGQPVRVLIDSREGAMQRRRGPAAGTAARDRDLARHIAQDLSRHGVMAVVGHSDPAIAIPAAAIYQHHGVLYLAPNTSQLSLTAFGFDLVFRMQPDHALLARTIADYFGTKGYQRIAVVQERSDTAHELSGLLVQAGAGHPGIRTAATMTFAPGAGDPDIRRLAVDVARLDHPDAVFLAANCTDSLRIVRELRHRGVTAPVYGGQDLDTDTFWSALQQWRLATGAPAGFAVPTVADFRSGVALRFAQAHTNTYGRAPQRLSALGYDSVKLVVQGLILAKAGVLGEAAATPLHLADELRYMQGCVGAAGSYHFFDDGNLRAKTMFIKALAREPSALPGAREAARPRAEPDALNFSFTTIRAEADLGLPECGDLNQHSGPWADQPAHEERP